MCVCSKHFMAAAIAWCRGVCGVVAAHLCTRVGEGCMGLCWHRRVRKWHIYSYAPCGYVQTLHQQPARHNGAIHLWLLLLLACLYISPKGGSHLVAIGGDCRREGGYG